VKEAIFKGATRPPMFMGIPLSVFGGVSGCAFVLCLWLSRIMGIVGFFIVGSVVVPFLLWIRWITTKDDHRANQFIIWMRLNGDVRKSNLSKVWGQKFHTFNLVVNRGRSETRKF